MAKAQSGYNGMLAKLVRAGNEITMMPVMSPQVAPTNMPKATRLASTPRTIWIHPHVVGLSS